MRIGADELSAAILEIYSAVSEPDGNPGQLSRIAAACLDSDSGVFQFMNAAPAIVAGGAPTILSCPSSTANLDSGTHVIYVQHYHDCNVWFKKGWRRGFPAIVLSQELVDERTFLHSEWYEFCQQRDLFHCIGVQFRLEGNFVAAFGAHRPRRAQAFDEDSRRTMAILLSHLQRACQMLHRLGVAAEHRRLTLDLLDRLHIGSIVVQADGRIRWANRIAETVLMRGTELLVHHGRLGVADPRYARALERRIAEAAKVSGAAGGLLHLSRATGPPLSLLVAPLVLHDFGPFRAPSALVLFSDPEANSRFATDAIAQTYALTRAECDLLSVGDYITPDFSAIVGYLGLKGEYKRDVNVSLCTNLVTHLRGINRSGAIVGYCNGHGFLLQNGTVTQIDYPDKNATSTFLEDISDKGLITGNWDDANNASHAFKLDTATNTFTPIKIRGATFTQVFGLNNAGLIAFGSDKGAFIYCPHKASRCPNSAGAIESPDAAAIRVSPSYFKSFVCAHGCSLGPRRSNVSATSREKSARGFEAALRKYPWLKQP